MVALSVSISATTSPAFTMSPLAFSHLARRPSVMVGERAGMRISVIVRPRSGERQYVGVEFRRVGFGTGLGEISRRRNNVLDLAVHVLQCRLIGMALVE